MKIIEHVTVFQTPVLNFAYHVGQLFLTKSDELSVLTSVVAFKIPAYHWEKLFWRLYNKYRFLRDHVRMKHLEIVFKVSSYIYLFLAIYSQWKVCFSSSYAPSYYV